MDGNIKFYNESKGWGIITSIKYEKNYSLNIPRDGQDYFFHISNVQGMVFPKYGDYVSFEEGPSKRGAKLPSAINVKISERKVNMSLPAYSVKKLPPQSEQTGPKRECKICRSMVSSRGTYGGRSHYQCRCGNEFTGRPYYGKVEKEPSMTAVAIGASLGSAGGVAGMILGAIIGSAFEKEVTMECLLCGGLGRPTGHNDHVTMFQCEQCLRKWKKKR